MTLGQEDLQPKAAIKHLTTNPIHPQRNPLPPVKSAFAYFCRD